MEQLYCGEMENPAEFSTLNRAQIDRALYDNPRIIPGLLMTEVQYLPIADYLTTVQKDIKQTMRREVATWMLEVCEEQGCEEVVFPLAINIMDRFLSRVNIHRSQLQLLASVTLLTASKLRQCRSFTVDQLCYYTDHSITSDELISWELLVLRNLQWDLGSVVATDYVDYALKGLLHTHLSTRVRQHAHTFISLCAIEYQFLTYNPSVIAGASIAAAVNGLHSGQREMMEETLHHLQETLHIDEDLLQKCVNQIEELLASSVMTLQQYNSGKQNTPVTPVTNKMTSSSTTTDLSQPETPTDVQDVHF